MENKTFDKIKKIFYYLIVASVIVTYHSCLDEIDLPVQPNLDEAIVIEGSLQIGTPSLVKITITRLFDFSASSLQPVNVREVLLLDENDSSLALKEIAPGSYSASIDNNATIRIEVGKSYRLKVTTFDNRQIISLPERILPTPEPGTVSVSQFKRERLTADGELMLDDFLAFTLETTIARNSDGKADRFLWTLEQTYLLTDSPNRSLDDGKKCYITQNVDVTSINILDGNEYSGSSSVTVPLFETPANYFFAEGSYITVYQHSLTEAAYDYWSQVSQVIDRTGNMFEAPAGTIRSNFVNVEDGESSENVFGYFYASQTDTVRFYVSPEAAGSPTMHCPWPVDLVPPIQGCPRFPCCECLEEKGSQTTKPDFWVQ